MSKQWQNQPGFTAVELLITLFVAVAFLVAGYQLYFIVIKDNGQTRAQAKAANVAYNYLRNYTSTATNPCAASTPLSNSPITVAGLSNATLSVTITCPYASSTGTNNATNISRIEAVLTYNSPAQTIRYVTFVHDANAAYNDIINGLVGWWLFNGNPNDTSGSGMNGTVNGATLVNGQNGSANSAYLFTGNGTTSYIALPNNSAANVPVFTMSAWINPQSTLANTIIGSVNSAGGPQFRYSSGTNAMKLELLNQNTVSIGQSTGTLPTGSWAFVTVTYDATGLYQFYINGSLSGSGTNLQTFTFSGYEIGRKFTTTSSEVFNGSMDDVRIYNRVLSPAEVNFLYNMKAR
jgi:Tfp pilus assembly protein PilE